jgi:ABC-type branched-subunit amino acid transport system permease subunit
VSTVNGLPVHALLVHFIVAIAPLTGLLVILCAIWPAARQRLVWLVLAMAAATAGMTPFVTESGEWLEHNTGESELIEKHAALGDTMIYFALALLIGAILVAAAHVRASRGKPLSTALTAGIAVFVVVAAAATTVQVVRIGHSGAESVWSDALPISAAGGAESGE